MQIILTLWEDPCKQLQDVQRARGTHQDSRTQINAMNLGSNMKTKVMTQSRKDFKSPANRYTGHEITDSSTCLGT